MTNTEYKITSAFHEETISNQDMERFDAIELVNNEYHVIIDNKSLKGTVVNTNRENKEYTIEVSGNTYQVKLSDSYDMLIDKMGLNALLDQKLENIFAPMPGLVLDVMVKIGDPISKGSPLMILEAMKMENVIKATGEGKVKSITISKGDTVDKDQLLIEMED